MAKDEYIFHEGKRYKVPSLDGVEKKSKLLGGQQAPTSPPAPEAPSTQGPEAFGQAAEAQSKVSAPEAASSPDVQFQQVHQSTSSESNAGSLGGGGGSDDEVRNLLQAQIAVLTEIRSLLEQGISVSV